MNSKANIFAPIKTTRVSEAIYNQISQKIIDGELKKGDKLPPERTLMELYERSRPTIREALRMLEQDGLIKTIPGNRGSFIVGFTTRNLEDNLKKLIESKNIDMNELFQYRLLNDSGYTVWAAENRTEDDLIILKSIIDKMKISTDDILLFLKYDKEFHRALADSSKNKIACIVNSILEQLSFDKMEAAVSMNTKNENKRLCELIYDSHLSIYNAIKERNGKLARKHALTTLKDFKDIVGYNK
ncbi:MAG TPA: FadR/GntR family transcriptional regulator [Clostridia bacterium]|nr:FadR/GntR family transcriptional regulator [Clostridia bacterium]